MTDPGSKTTRSPQTEAKAFTSDEQRNFAKTCLAASRFAGRDGRLATAPDIVNQRLTEDPGKPSWDMTVTTATFQIAGHTKGGNGVVVISHGLRPFVDVPAFAVHHDFCEADKASLEIPTTMFRLIESGAFGPVEAVAQADLPQYQCPPSLLPLTVKQAMAHPLIRAILGPNAVEYLKVVEKAGGAEHSDRRVILFGAPRHKSLVQVLDEGPKDSVTVHPIVVGAIFSHDYPERLPGNLSSKRTGTVTELSCHEPGDAATVIGIRARTAGAKPPAQEARMPWEPAVEDDLFFPMGGELTALEKPFGNS